MLELVQYIVNQFAEDKEHIEYAVNEKERVIEIVVTLPSSDMGKVIGKQGRAIKEVSSFARQDMEKFLGKKVFLTTYVKVKEDWRDKPGLMKEYGYEEFREL